MLDEGRAEQSVSHSISLALHCLQPVQPTTQQTKLRASCFIRTEAARAETLPVAGKHGRYWENILVSAQVFRKECLNYRTVRTMRKTR